MRRFAVALLLAGTALACEAPPTASSEPEPETVPAPTRAAPEDEAPPAAWPSDVQDLAAEIDGFESVAACIEALRSRTPTNVAEAVSDLGYDELFDDTCRGLEAVRDRSAAACDGLSVSSAQRGCRRRVALVAEDPAACPTDRAIDGRDALCVAWAARDAGLCRATTTSERAACEAVLANDASWCARAARAERGRCETWVRRYGAAAARGARASGVGAQEASSFTLAFRHAALGEAPAEDATPETLPAPRIDRGLHLRVDGCSYVVVLDEIGARRPPPAASAGARIALRVTPTADPVVANVSVESVDVVLPGGALAIQREASAELEPLVPIRGAPFVGRLRARLGAGGFDVVLDGEVRTFVRDVDALPDRCSGDRLRGR